MSARAIYYRTGSRMRTWVNVTSRHAAARSGPLRIPVQPTTGWWKP